MKKVILKFWTEVDKQKKILTLRVYPFVSENEISPDGYIFIQQRMFNVYIEKYEVVKDESSPDWRNYLKVHVVGGLRLGVYSDRYPVYLNLPVAESE